MGMRKKHPVSLLLEQSLIQDFTAHCSGSCLGERFAFMAACGNAHLCVRWRCIPLVKGCLRIALTASCGCNGTILGSADDAASLTAPRHTAQELCIPLAAFEKKSPVCSERDSTLTAMRS